MFDSMARATADLVYCSTRIVALLREAARALVVVIDLPRLSTALFTR
jgi:hypothetical protein